MDDMTLLREYAARNSEAAFAELVSRRIGFVYSAALRQVRDPHLAEEITQAVFTILAQKAGKISDKTNLIGWLFKTTRFAALAQIRAAAKRSLRMATIEKEFQMQNEFQSPAADEIWNQMSLLLDEALAALGETDRQAVLLRFFENKTLAEVGKFLGIGEDTARKRVSRALEKLRRYFSKRGVTSTTATIAEKISTNSVQAAPVALAKTVTAVALAKGTAASLSTSILVKGASRLMARTKWKAPVVSSLCILFTFGVTIFQLDSATHHEGIEAGGTITLTTYVGTNILIEETNAFLIGVNGKRWKLKATTLGLKIGGVIQTNKFDYVEAGCDSLNTFDLHSMETTVKQVRSTPFVATADICNETIPSRADDFIRNLWLAYASADYLSSASNGWIYPLFFEKKDARSVIGEFAVKAHWNYLPGKPLLPASVVYTFDFEGAVSQTNDLPPTYDFSERSTNAVYMVLAYTNCGGAVWPTHFIVKHYLPNGRLTQEVEAYSEVAPRQTLNDFSGPHFPGLTYVSDFRLGEIENPITYIGTNWLTNDRLKKLQMQKKLDEQRAAGVTLKRTGPIRNH